MLKQLKTQHRTVAQMCFSGFTNNEIAERMEMSPSTVSQILTSPLGKAYLDGLNDKAQENTLDVRKKLTSLNASALNAFERILDPRQKANPSVQATVAKDILDRNGYKPPDKHVIDMTMSVKTDEEIDAEIKSLEESIKKTTLQDPIKQVAKSPSKIVSTVIEAKESEVIDETIETDFFDINTLDIFDSSENTELDEAITPDENVLTSIPKDIFNSAKVS